ncbi:MAG: tryptophan 2,3-dioxygenase family protein [Chloroflexota bacterium]|nr:tryptophan 2,3-dioxygenase family protein [Chloroflexota bacterium]
MTADNDLTYSDYLHLPEMLALQMPAGPPEMPMHAQAAEHFFIVVHQAFELWFKQQLLDLRCATDALDAGDSEVAVEHLLRVAGIQRLLNDQMLLLDHLPPRSFMEFRPALGTASGSESGQFHKIQHALGLRSLDESPVWVAFRGTLDRASIDLEALYREPSRAGGLYRIAEALVDVSETNWLMAAMHVRIADRAIGDRPGTAGTSGVAYLMEALKEKAFPELWAVRTRL